MVGTMIEIPRAALLADEIAEVAEFFSFGTNDLTQMTLGLSRDDAGRFLPDYVDPRRKAARHLQATTPSSALDQDGRRPARCKMAIEKGRSTPPGPQGRHLRRARRRVQTRSSSATRVGMNYVSCSPFRVPIARLAAAQAVIEDKIVAKAAADVVKAKAARSAARKTAAGKTKASIKPAAKKVPAKAEKKAVAAKKPVAKAVAKKPVAKKLVSKRTKY